MSKNGDIVVAGVQRRLIKVFSLSFLCILITSSAIGKSLAPEKLGELAARLDYCGFHHMTIAIQQENRSVVAFNRAYSESQIDEVQIIMGIVPEVDCDAAKNLFIAINKIAGKTARSALSKNQSEREKDLQKKRLQEKVNDQKSEQLLKKGVIADTQVSFLVLRAKEALQILGLYDGKLDSVLGAKAKIGIRKWQKGEGLKETGKLHREQVAAMEQDAIWHVAKFERDRKILQQKKLRDAQKKSRAKERLVAKKREQERRKKALEQKRLEDIKRAKVVYDFAVIVGNRDYSGRTHRVEFAQNDANAMREFLLSEIGFLEGNIIDLRNATKAQMEETFGSPQSYKGRLYDYVKEGESDIVVFYSGHGVPGLQDRRGYLLPVDANPNKAELTGYPLDILFKNLKQINAKSIRVFIDACFSGDSHSGTLIRKTSGVTVKITTPKNLHSNMMVITASKRNQFASWDEETQHGLFTHHLLKALRGAADNNYRTGNKDGKVTLREVKSYLDQEMTYQARRKYSRIQQADVKGDLNAVLFDD
ncbi:MAG: hypothetical protein CMM58_02085 [Rhodospirillaceae bacterium]|nr:hypothetical protein [Rhodospirillaceae bacterium]|tara:strand:- start:1017 stop:2621 length:1605 start_codon:yes stop_codon:yes gene_type:complete